MKIAANVILLSIAWEFGFGQKDRNFLLISVLPSFHAL